MALLPTLLSTPAAVLCVAPIDWNRFFQINPASKRLDFLCDFAADFAKKPERRQRIQDKATVIARVRARLAETLSFSPEEIDVTAAFEHYGLDSISGVQFCSFLDQDYPDCVSPMDLYRHCCVAELSEHIVQQSESGESPPPQTPAITALSDEDLEALLAAEVEVLETLYDA